MFCNFCGCELSDGSKFCNKCGNAIGKIAESKTAEVSKEDFSVSKTVTVDEIVNLGTKENLFTGRVDSTDDRAANNALFSMYKSLIQPVREIEGYTYKINIETDRLNHLKGEIYVSGFPKFVKIVLFVLLMLAVLNQLVYNPTFEGPMTELDHAGKDKLLWAILIVTCILIPIAGVILLQCVFKAVRKHFIRRKNDKIIPGVEDSITKLKGERENLTRSVADQIRYVPPAYRTSKALTTFCEAYNNSKVDNLKEAVAFYDQTVRDSVQKGIQDNTALIYERLKQIDFVAFVI